jgi:hypothetical protein
MSPQQRARKPRRTSRPGGQARRAVTTTSRHTPSSRRRPPRIRPEWHKAVGVASIVAGFALFFVCRFDGRGIHDYGGHVWEVPAFVIGVSSIW